MSFKSKLTSKLSTLEAARTTFFIVVGLGIKESLGIFSLLPERPRPNWHWITFVMVGAGYLATAIRFIHGISMLHGHEKWRLENSNLPSSQRISSTALFIILLAVFLYLMAINITHFQRYICFTSTMLIVDLFLIGFSEALSLPFHPKTLFLGWRNTTDGYQSQAALQWIWSDVILLIIANLLLIYDYFNFEISIVNAGINPILPIEAVWGSFLLIAFVADYWINSAFYFGDRTDWRSQKFVFVSSRLSPESGTLEDKKEEEIKKNINLAQLYCKNLTGQKNIIFRNITPFASHGFYTYFLNELEGENKDKNRTIARQCALAYLSACDAIYIYIPDVKKKKEGLSDGMEYELNEAKKMGLEIKYLRANEQPPNLELPEWHPLTWTKPPEEDHSITVKRNDRCYEMSYQEMHSSEEKDNFEFEGNVLRKRVYVCTNLRGQPLSLDEILTEEQKKQNKTPSQADLKNQAIEALKKRMKQNVSNTLWQCYNLATDDEAFIAPFAPQAFFTYFWKFPIDVEKKGGKWSMKKSPEWEVWFQKSLEVLKVCDAVYIYSEDGLPNSKNLSPGMTGVFELAERLGVEITYKKEKPIKGDWKPAVPNF